MQTFFWVLAVVLMVVGLAGTVVPLIPGVGLIFIGALVHYFGVGAEKSVGLVPLGVMLGLMLLAQALDFLSGTLGAKYFGATRWGIFGGIVGFIVGLFFGLPGIIIGPLAGVLVGELIGGQKLGSATKSTWGTLLGTTAGMIAKIIIALLMIGTFALGLWLKHHA